MNRCRGIVAVVGRPLRRVLPLDLGSTLGPVWFGYLLDHGMGRSVFVGAGACFLVAIATVMQVRRATVARPA